MAKYVIEIPDSEETMWEGFNGDLFIPITMNKGTKTWINTDLKMTPYTEPDREAIDLQHAHDIENVARMNYNKGAENAWEFARRIICPSDCCENSISAHTKEIFNKEGWEIRGIFNDLSYQEAKAKYDAWRKQKEEIRVGDELKDDENIRAVVLDIIVDDYVNYEVFTENGITDEWEKEIVVKTGRYFPEVVELLKKMREE